MKREAEQSESSNKRMRFPSGGDGPMHPVFGQRSTLPGLSGAGYYSKDDNLTDNGELPEDAFAYLRGVRSQAARIPISLRSKQLEIDEAAVAPEVSKRNKPVYGDGAVVYNPFDEVDESQEDGYEDDDQDAYPEDYDEEEAEEYDEDGEWDEYEDTYDDDTAPSQIPARDAYYSRLLRGYHDTQKTLAQLQSRLSERKAYRTSSLAGDVKSTWQNRFKTVCIDPYTLVSMDAEACINAIDWFTQCMSWQLLGYENAQAWAWGLLTRLDAETLNGEELCVVRNLGKLAVKRLQRSPDPRRRTEHHSDRSENEAEDTPRNLGEDRAIDIAINSAKKFKALTDDGANLLRPWIDAILGLKVLCARLAAVNGDIQRLSDKDQDALTEAVETANRESEKASAAGRQSKEWNKAVEDTNEPAEQEITPGDAAAFEDGPSEDNNSSSTSEPIRYPGGESLSGSFATLDMIILIVGEVFGQRDLLNEDVRERCWLSSQIAAEAAGATSTEVQE